MALIKYNNLGIKAISATVPSNIAKTIEQQHFSEKQLRGFIDTTGVAERRIANEDMCASDLCYDAAQKLFESSVISPDKVDALIFLSQTPDYRVPSTSIILQDRLKLKRDTLAFDMNMTCSGFIYGLFVAYSIANTPGVDNVLLLIGETLSKIISPKDKSTGLLLGDGACAILISKGEQFKDTFFSLNTDGRYKDSVIIPGGGFRCMSSAETLKSSIYEDGSERTLEQLAMEGMDVFSFAMTYLPKDVKKLLEFAGLTQEQIDKIIFHQANKYMMDFIANKLKLDMSKMLYSIQKYGNTSGVSIPLTLVDQKDKLEKDDLLLLNGIGAGFSYGSVILSLSDCLLIGVNEL